MAKPCFVKQGADPPLCGVHNVALVEHQSLEFHFASKLGEFTFLVCPVSGLVVNDPATHK